ncbi:MAG: hypothetical protein WDN67_04190 [Candidatus Moraniibacteriota bacterium]
MASECRIPAISSTVTARPTRKAFDGKLEFTVKLIPYTGDDAWVSDMLVAARACLEASSLPEAHPECDYCGYRAVAARHEAAGAGDSNLYKKLQNS